MSTLTATAAPRETRANDRAGLVEIDGVHKSYGAHEVLHGISLRVEPGQVVSLLGPSGSGKSTLLRAINHLETIDGGSITIDGEYIGYERRGDALHELPEKEVLARRTRVGMVFQNFNLFPHLTALENIIEAPIGLKRARRSEAVAQARVLLERVGLADRESHYPRQLSGGQQQRVAIARALALEPDVLLFDEPTSALDPELVGEVLRVIRDLAHGGTTLIIVTHEIGFAAEVSDHVVFLDAGRVVEAGSPQQVLRAPEQARTQEFLDWVI
ncbi:amino acid ABC transporter ATP-binding protein [Leucobacter chromiiresistens]|uniref:ABC-type polar-amino-acid transporter n=1 Tax=Leucobacter chromiiresistens TaxID=1079994 RepID=A0A1H0Y3I4_9MICO|nr:amino acid ABC transporter ATP-binding protein [Leucobacter chromiiresistens]SDQ09631.1 amino acid ABC transporter ATP-binding protein, PAAT family [Leucobacter chromiiresistens]